jgi:hypothetical protein
MATITFTIPDEKLQRVIDSISGLYPVPQVTDPEWVDPGDGSAAPMVDQFTPAQWAKEFIRRQIVNIDYRYRKKVEREASLIVSDDELAT